MSDIISRLSAMKDNFAKSKVQYDTMFGGTKLPASVYEAQLTKCFIKETSGGNLRINRQFVIISDGEFNGVSAWDGVNIDGEKGPIFARRFVEQCEYEFPEDDPAELVAICKAIEDERPCFKIKVVHNGDFTNINIQQRIAAPEDLSGTGGGNGAEDSNVPETPAQEAAADDNAASDELDELTTRFREFCLAQLVDEQITDEMDLDTLKGICQGYTFMETELDQTEVDLLTEVGLQDRIKKPTPPPAAKPKPAPAKASTPAKAAPAPAPAPAKRTAPPAAAAPARRTPAKAR